MALDLSTAVLQLGSMKRKLEADLATIDYALKALEKQQRDRNAASWAKQGVTFDNQGDCSACTFKEASGHTCRASFAPEGRSG